MKFIFNTVLALLYLGGPVFSQTDSLLPRLRDERFWLSGQANFVFQVQPGIDAPYRSANSFSRHYEKATSEVLTFYSGAQLTPSLEVLADVEVAGGETLSRGLGIGAPPNADFIDRDVVGCVPYLSRLMLHKVIRLSRANDEGVRTPLSTFASVPRERIELRIGKFSLPDFFDVSASGADTHLGFLNSAAMQNAAFDYASDASGYSWGLLAEYDRPRWSLRFAEMLMPKSAGSEQLEWDTRKGNSENLEVQIQGTALPHKATVLRVLAFKNHARMNDYDSDGDADDRNPSSSYGIGVNLEQVLNRNVTAFARAGWNSGHTESFCYDEVDRTLAAGATVNGLPWHRSFDRAGIAIASNGISPLHREYLAAGNMGMLLGDGALRYGREFLLETFYTFRVKPGVYVSPSLQWIANPGYNRDDGHALIAGLRTHLEF